MDFIAYSLCFITFPWMRHGQIPLSHFGQIADQAASIQLLVAFHYAQLFCEISQLSNVSRPPVALQEFNGILFESDGGSVVAF